MSALLKFERKSLELQCDDKTVTKPCWCYGELLVVETRLDNKPMWQIGCQVREGRPMFPVRRLGLFDNLEDACEAAVELDNAYAWVEVETFGHEHKELFNRLHDKYHTRTDVASPELIELVQMLKSLSRPTLPGAAA